jgi:serine/threonine protein kinase
VNDPIATLASALAERYRVERVLGAGGMATVHLAEDLRHRRPVAIKVLRPDLGVSVGAERFLREIRIAAQLQHPHIVPVFDSGEASGLLWYAMPLVEGETLRARLARDGRLPVAEAARIAREVADALGYAHGRGVVHRDIKPENILLSRGHALVTDFGVAKAISAARGGADRPEGLDGPRDLATVELTTAGISLGTPTYMAPEQAVGAVGVDHRADIYALVVDHGVSRQYRMADAWRHAAVGSGARHGGLLPGESGVESPHQRSGGRAHRGRLGGARL